MPAGWEATAAVAGARPYALPRPYTSGGTETVNSRAVRPSGSRAITRPPFFGRRLSGWQDVDIFAVPAAMKKPRSRSNCTRI